MVGWVDHGVRHDGVLQELLRLAHLVRPAQLHRVAKAVQKPKKAGLSSVLIRISNLKLA